MNTVHTSTVIRVLAVSSLLHCTVNRRLLQFFPSSEWCDFITRNLEYGLLVLCNFTIRNCFISLHLRGHLRSYRSVSLLMSLDQIGRSDAEAQTFCFYEWFGWIDKVCHLRRESTIIDASTVTWPVEKCHMTVPTSFVSFGYVCMCNWRYYVTVTCSASMHSRCPLLAHNLMTSLRMTEDKLADERYSWLATLWDCLSKFYLEWIF